jgi:hypothetical protein
MRRFLAFAAVCALLAVTLVKGASGDAMAAPPQTEAQPPVTELIILYDPLSSAPSVSEILDAVNLRTAETLRSSLGSPDSAAKVITRITDIEGAGTQPDRSVRAGCPASSLCSAEIPGRCRSRCHHGEVQGRPARPFSREKRIFRIHCYPE